MSEWVGEEDVPPFEHPGAYDIIVFFLERQLCSLLLKDRILAIVLFISLPSTPKFVKRCDVLDSCPYRGGWVDTLWS